MRSVEQVIHDSLQEWNTDEFVELNWNSRAAQSIVKALNADGYSIVSAASDEALRAFAVHATYPVSTEINARGYAWRGEEALDYAKGLADRCLALPNGVRKKLTPQPDAADRISSRQRRVDACRRN